MSADPFAPVGGKLNGSAPPPARPEWLPVLPVPEGAPAPPAAHPKLGKASARWTYFDGAGRLLGFSCRFDDGKGGKSFRPLALYARAGGGKLVWRWEAWPAPRPLYGLDRLAANPKCPVVLCEGEKAADAAGKLLPGYVCITSPNGSKSAVKADWSPLAGRAVTIWPDFDESGRDYAQQAGMLTFAAGAKSVAVAIPPETASAGWDAADALAEGWTEKRALALLKTAELLERPAGNAKAGGKGERPRRVAQRDSLMALMERCNLWHAPGGETFATMPVNGHRENWPIQSREFRRWLAARSYEATGSAPGTQALEEALRVQEARAASEGLEQAPWRRTGWRNGKHYIDLCDATWRAVEIGADAWRVLAGHDLPFVRSPRMRPLCEPEAGYDIAELRPFANVATEDDFYLLVAWVLAAMRHKGPYPVLILNGEQGSGKSELSRFLRDLVDPSSPAVQGPPKDEQGLIVSAQNGHLIALDNISHIDGMISDALCRLSTGSGFAVRALHTDKDENIFEGARPILLNGIPAFAERPDLSERSIVVRLLSVEEHQRRAVAEMNEAWTLARPRILGAIFDGLSSAVKRIESTSLERMGRMADFEQWARAGEPGLGFERGTISAAYSRNRRESTESSFENDQVAVAILKFMDHAPTTLWAGTATELLGKINGFAPDNVRDMRIWPKTAQKLANDIERGKPLLRGKGLLVERRHSGQTIYTITRIAKPLA